MNEEFFIIDWEKIDQEIISRLSAGDVWYSHAGSVLYDKNGIVKHLPLKKVFFEDNKINEKLLDSIGELIKNNEVLSNIDNNIQNILLAQKANLMLTAVSTCAIIGVVVCATNFLCNKIDNLSNKMQNIKEHIKAIGYIQDAQIISKYESQIKNFTKLITHIKENSKEDLYFNNQISDLSTARGEFHEILKKYYENFKNNKNKEVKERFFNVLIYGLNLIPYGAYIENYSLCALQKFNVAIDIAKETCSLYHNLKDNIISLYNNDIKMLLSGKQTEYGDIFINANDIMQYIKSTSSKEILLSATTTIGNVDKTIKEIS